MSYKHYYVGDSVLPTGDYEVHTGDCVELARVESKTYLGYYDNCQDAIRKASDIYPNVYGCKYCSPGCHRR
ncbi:MULTISPECIES: hypothetical protein [unclassified Mesotoga]|uniref:hypothetical protein n=1 Tax=unclassified Mesotoga TaxID=1184398 RepID=UPI000EF277DE|nr:MULTISPECIES: hypothetical protein [unclassified Mesotoga]MDI9369249.1 hypothetical protein [Thermotogota bacterium]NLT43894.1 hypothetical protein [Thermotogaceae bacterium]MDD3681154.1 hypothetical protein [Mesotoga sp.]MDD4207946.1 hypothetical protein [Mesotoga sp.]MDD4826707.1 hypothetical protein [Mesotoga sp.]